MGEFEVGRVLGRAFAIWFRNLVPFTILSAIVYLPVIAWGLMLALGDPTLEEFGAYFKYSGYVMMLLGFIATGAITFGVFSQLKGEPASIGRCIGVGLSRLLPIIGVGLLAGLVMGVGYLLLIVPGVILSCMLWVAVPAAVVERTGVWESLKRSRELTLGNKAKVFGIMLVLGLISLAVTMILRMIIVGDLTSSDDVHATLTFYLVVNLLSTTVLGALQSVANAVGYYDLRQSKEGAQIDELIRVFE